MLQYILQINLDLSHTSLHISPALNPGPGTLAGVPLSLEIRI